ncbi:hypothetical protein Tsubulata_037223 [Turnera subulata]|uniref:rRNA N-glycosidase n=1 Tax=Turnera subulata TaxID=218843 RepID=A0A9Q0FQN4_9ROSI|nr:hypothetical protein Tsubulata_037223 [Turnera subulata]
MYIHIYDDDDADERNYQGLQVSKGRKMKLCRVQVGAVVVGAWVCLILVVGSGAVQVGPSRVEEGGDQEYPYPAEKISSTFRTVEFNLTGSTTTRNYRRRLINVMRNQLRSSIYFFDIPSLPRNKVTGVNRFGLVTINYDNGQPSSCLSGHRCQQYICCRFLLRESNGKTAKGLLLLYWIKSAIQALYNRRDPFGLKNSLSVVIQMVSEFVRSDLVMNRVLADFSSSRAADGDMQFVENNWASNSKAVLSVTSSSKYFATNITLPESRKVIRNVDDANRVGLVSLLWSPTASTTQD